VAREIHRSDFPRGARSNPFQAAPINAASILIVAAFLFSFIRKKSGGFTLS
jgi:hypothetical protein